MSDIMQARKALIARILEGDGGASPAQRCAAFAACISRRNKCLTRGSTLPERHHTSRIA
jgi:hypothetical protein